VIYYFYQQPISGRDCIWPAIETVDRV